MELKAVSSLCQTSAPWKPFSPTPTRNCSSASPVISARVLSNWYPIEEGIQLYGATYDSTEHFWQAVKYHPEVTVAQLQELLARFQGRNWTLWMARLDADPELYLAN